MACGPLTLRNVQGSWGHGPVHEYGSPRDREDHQRSPEIAGRSQEIARRSPKIAKIAGNRAMRQLVLWKPGESFPLPLTLDCPASPRQVLTRRVISCVGPILDVRYPSETTTVDLFSCKHVFIEEVKGPLAYKNTRQKGAQSQTCHGSARDVTAVSICFARLIGRIACRPPLDTRVGWPAMAGSSSDDTFQPTTIAHPFCRATAGPPE